MISINNLSFYLGDRVLYQDASLFIGPKDRIGLIGLNGTGKSTLLRMLVNEVKPAEGEISKSKETTIGFLNQDLLSYQSEESIVDVALQAFGQTIKVGHQIDAILKQMESNYEDALVDKLAKLQDQFQHLDGYTVKAQAEEILEGIGFQTSDLTRPLREFSGGWRMRVMLAKLLLEKPSLLMLDEPTNHLDLPSIQWIENYLQTYEGAFIIVSHDRRFLNSCVNKIVEVSGGQLNLYTGNYDKFESEKELRNEIQQNAYENQQQKIKQTERFIERFKAKATKAKQAQSRMKMLDKMERVDAVVDDTAQINFKFNFSTKSGRHVKRLHDIHKSYGDLNILDHTNGHIERGDKIALIGANGKGKSTLLRIIAETEKYQGKVESGHNVLQAFYAQHQLESLNPENEILEELKQAGSKKTDLELRGVLGCFLFSDDEVFKKIKVLSGGEKSRVALAKTLISEANFLLLDEPTNHLDMLSVNILVQALQQYQGTFLLVSHDRDFISRVATKIWWIEDRQLKEYPGNYQEFEWWWEKREKEVKPQQQAAPKTKSNASGNEKPRIAQPEKEVEKRINELEDKILYLEEELGKLEAELTKPEVFSDSEKSSKLNNKYESKKSELGKINTEWERLVDGGTN